MFLDLDTRGEPLGTPWASHGAAVSSHGRPTSVPWGARVAPMGRQWGAMGSHWCSMRLHWVLHEAPLAPHGARWFPGGISSPSQAMLRSSLDICGLHLRPSWASYGTDGVLLGSSLGRLGAKLCHLKVSLGSSLHVLGACLLPSWANLGSPGIPLGPLGTILKPLGMGEGGARPASAGSAH